MAFLKPANSGVEVPVPGEAASLNPRPAYQQRVIAEATDLDTRRLALAEFIKGPVFGTLDIGEQARLKLQFQMMTGYAIVLHDRMAHFPVV